MLEPIMREVARLNFEGKLQAVAEEQGEATQTMDFGDWKAVVSYGGSPRGGGGTARGNATPMGRALVAKIGANQFWVTGAFCRIDFRPASGGQREFLRVEEVAANDGKSSGGGQRGAFRFVRIWNGDETDWGLNFNSALSGYPLAISAVYGQGTFCVLAIPDDFADLYRLPQSVLNQIRALLGRDVFVSLDAPDHVSLFPYDNRTFIVQNFQPQPVRTRVSIVRATRLHDLLTGQTLAGSEGRGGRGGRGGFGGGGTSFEVAVPTHSFRVFAAE
jgi:hypothetical protein